ncbi:DUF2141 domain-containing protein [Crocinitomix algicola]|uniref:DUF2141 domain-containing protein n=1 Tax=Crocinitomix algicola TaxID=1740263 RepID=UPI000872AB50|nr:DUF2141 domain-containing protein [Crocinitomix algicola]
MKPLKLLLLLGLTSIFTIGQAATLKIAIKNIRSSKGRVSIGLYKNDDAFQNDRPMKKIKISKSALKGGKLSYSLDLPAGTYGLALLDDENSNDEMDSNFIGIPNEGYGFSNYVHSGMFKPSFSDFKFTVKDGVINSVTIAVDYF